MTPQARANVKDLIPAEQEPKLEEKVEDKTCITIKA
jgi:hypothetical protein